MGETDTAAAAVTKLPTGLPGFEFIAQGGLPCGRATLLAGSSGSGKTVFGAQFLTEGIRQYGEAGVFVTFEEPPAAIRANLASLDWPLAEWEEAGRLAFVDLSPGEEDPEVSGAFDLGALVPRIEHAVNRTGATRVVIDSLGTLYGQFQDQGMVRRALGQLFAGIRRLGVTAVVTAERTEEYGAVARSGVEAFVADSVILLRNVLEGERRRRTIEILKMRGTSHDKGEFPFTVSREAGGVNIIPLSAIDLNQASSEKRVPFGNPELDHMCGGGLLQGSVTLVGGPTGTGKTLVASHFLTASPEERALLLAFEEGSGQLRRNAAGWDLPFAEREAAGRLHTKASYPETGNLEDHLVRIKQWVEQIRPDRVAIDSLTALERVGSDRSFREFVIALVAFLREKGITLLVTANTTSIGGGTSASEAQISSMTDTIVVLRYIEQASEVQRALAVLKMRGSDQDKRVRSFSVSSRGLTIGDPLPMAGESIMGLAKPG